MGFDDVAVQTAFRQCVLPWCGYVLLGLVLRRWLSRALDYRPYICDLFAEGTLDRRRRLLRGLHVQAEALDRPLRVLELGVRSGANLSCYPNGCDILCLTTDQRAEQHIRSLVSEDFPNLRLLECVEGGGGVLAGMDDCCLDAVVLTHALDTEIRPASTLRNIHRLLRPRGRCYFVEHQTARRWTPAWLSWRVLSPVYRTLGLWSGVSMDTTKLLRDAPFSHMQLDTFPLETDSSLWETVFVPPWARWNISGYASK